LRVNAAGGSTGQRPVHHRLESPCHVARAFQRVWNIHFANLFKLPAIVSFW
jgi:hypothetical protein